MSKQPALDKNTTKNTPHNISEASENLRNALSAFEAVIVSEKFEQDEKEKLARKRLLLKLKNLLKDLS